MSSTCPHNMVNFGRLTAEICWRVWGTPARHLVVGISQTLRRWTEGATHVRQGDHHVGHWPTFLVPKVIDCMHQTIKTFLEREHSILLYVTRTLYVFQVCHGVIRCVKDESCFSGWTGWAGARRELLDFMVQGKTNRGRHKPSGWAPLHPNQPVPTSIIPQIVQKHKLFEVA